MSNARNLANLLGTATAIPSGKLPSGTNVQTVTASGIDFVGNKNGLSINTSTATKLIEKAITIKTLNPIIYAMTMFGIGTPSSYQDYDIAIGFGFKTGTATTTVTDYSVFGGTDYSRQNVDPLDSFYACDVKGAHSTGSEYWCETKSSSHSQQITASIGTVINIGVWATTQAGAYYIHRPQSHSADAEGELGSLTVMEIVS
tara:strand:- start:733 stop:1335 length:603 start_codon:yes stop_codon:yes gene_type:complete